MARDHNLRARRERLGLKQTEVADRVGCWASYIGKAETGKMPSMVARVRRAIVEFELDRRRQRRADAIAREGMAAEAAAIAHREALWLAVPDSPEKLALQDAMLERAEELLYQGRCEEADAICEFLPAELVKPMLDAWDREFNGATT